MSKPKSGTDSYVSAITVQISDGHTFNIKRDLDGDYTLEDVMTDTTIFIGDAKIARQIATDLGSLLDWNDE